MVYYELFLAWDVYHWLFFKSIEKYIYDYFKVLTFDFIYLLINNKK